MFIAGWKYVNVYPQPLRSVCLTKGSGRVHRQYITPDGIDEVDLKWNLNGQRI